MEKTTLRLPEWQLERLRAESRRQHRSLNSVAIDVLTRGLGGRTEQQDVVRALGSFVRRPALRPYRPSPPVEGEEPVDLVGALDWARGDR